MIENDERITIYLDADDTIMQSSEAAIAILNHKYDISPPKTVYDLKDWRYRSIYKYVKLEEVEEIFESDEFYRQVKLNPVFCKFYERNLKYFRFVIVTKGTQTNLDKKKEYLTKYLRPGFEYVGILWEQEKDGSNIYDYSKTTVDMKKGIQIDDRTDCLLGTNAAIKILYKHDTETTWNQGYINESVYAVNTWDEIIEILNFVKDNHYLFKKA